MIISSETGALPATVLQPMTLYFTAAADTEMLLRAQLQEMGLSLRQPYSDISAVSMDTDQLQAFRLACTEHLDPIALEQILCYLASADQSVTAADLMHAQKLSALLAWAKGLWLHNILNDRQLFTHFQPIVDCQHPTQVFAYECLLRGRGTSGDVISPVQLYDAARDSGLLAQLDSEARLTAIDSASIFDLHSRVFVNFNPRAIVDPIACMESSLRAVTESCIDNERFVFEVVESDEVRDPNALTQIVHRCRETGCGVALDDVGAGYSSLNLMARIKPDFIKIDMELVRDVYQDPYKSCVVAKLLELAEELDAKTVVEGVETEQEWRWATEHGAHYAQGYLFARPNEIPPEPNFLPANPTVAAAATSNTVSNK